MRLSIVRSGTAAVVAAAALAACGGHGTVPSALGGTSPAFPARRHVVNCHSSAVQPAWIFMGACTVGFAQPKGATLKLLAYKGYTLSIKLPASNAKKNTPFVLADALGKGDVKSYKGKKFPLSKGAFLYAQGVNGGKVVINPKPQYNVTLAVTSKAGYPGTNCGLGYLNKYLQWSQTPVVATPKRHNLVFVIPDALIVQLGGLKTGPLFFAMTCVK